MISSIKDIYLYTGAVQKTIAQSNEIKEWLEANQVPFTHLHYGDKETHKEIFSAVMTWWQNKYVINAFPFIVYTEVHSGIPDHLCPRILLQGAPTIKKSNLVELSRL